MRARVVGLLTLIFAIPIACSHTGGGDGGGGCAGGDGIPADDDTGDDDAGDDDTSGDDGPQILYTEPAEGSSDVHYRTTLEVGFTAPVGLVSIELQDEGGAVSGEVELDETGTVATFDPFGDDPWTHLAPLTAHTATIAWTGHEGVALSFSTSDVGLPVSSSDLEGNSYLVDLGSGEFTEPPGIGSLLSQYMTDVFPLLHVLDVDDEAGTIEFGMGDSEDTVIGEWQNPYLRLGPTTLIVFIEGIEAEVTDVILDGDFQPDGSRLVEGGLEGLFDTRFMDQLIDPGADEGVACDLLESLEIECLECPSDGELFCLRVVARGVVADRL